MKTKLLVVTIDFIKTVQKDDISAWAAKLTFFLLLSIFPFSIFLVELLSQVAFNNTGSIYELTNLFPPEIINILELIIQDISSAQTPSSVLPLAIIGTIWAASKGIMAIIGGLNMAYKEEETRSYFFLRILSLVYTLAFAFMILITLGLIVFGRKLLNFLFEIIPYLVQMGGLFDFLRWLFSLLLSFLFFILLYNATPNRKISFKEVMPGAIFATSTWVLLSYGFSIYINYSTSLSYMYGSITGIIILLLWLYFTSFIIMLGGELNAVISEKKSYNQLKQK